MSAKSTSCPLIPEKERKCIWMSTGLISYKLCDRNYQCESCPFDQAIKNEAGGEGGGSFPESTDKWPEESLATDPSVGINGHIFYHPDHCWVKVENPAMVKIGIDNLLAQLIADVKVVILPRAGSFAARGECCAHIIQEDYILPVVSPLSGSIGAANPRLQKKPELITDDPGGEGWLITIKPQDLESDLKKLLFGRKALSWYQQAEKELIARTDVLLKQNAPSLGPTMQDGGVRISRLKDLLSIVTPKQRTQLLDFSLNRLKNVNYWPLNPPAPRNVP